MKYTKMMSVSACVLFLASIVLLAIAAQARTLPASESCWQNKISMVIEYGRSLNTPPPSPKSAPPNKQITNIGSDELTATNYDRPRMSPPPSPKPSSPESQLHTAFPDNGKIKNLSPPPPPVSSKSPTQSENNASQRSSSSTFITMVFGRTFRSPPLSPKPAPSSHNDFKDSY